MTKTQLINILGSVDNNTEICLARYQEPEKIVSVTIEFADDNSAMVLLNVD